MRGEIELPALGIAFVLLTAMIVLGISTAQFAFGSAERSALERQSATSLSDALVNGDAQVTRDRNILDESEIETLNETTLRERYGLPEDSDARITLDKEVLVTAGEPTAGTRIERIVLVEAYTEQTLVPPFEETKAVTLPRRTSNATVEIEPPAETTVRTVWSNNRVVLRNESGLEGSFDVSLSRMETVQLRFDAIGELPEGSVEVTYYPTTTRKATLSVVVDA